MANSFPGSGLAYADAFSVGTANSVNSSLYVCSSCVQATRIEHIYSQTNLHHNTLWLRANNAGARAGASIGFTVVNNGGDHHRANIEATANSGQIGGNLALYTRNNNGNDQLGIYIDNAGNVGIGTESPNVKLNVAGNLTLSGGTRCILLDGGSLYIDTENVSGRNILLQIHSCQKVAIGTNSPLANVRTDVRSTSSLTSAVGQPMFLGSNDTTGPLGVVIQHICGNGVCRVDFTSTRYGISGNDLSLNVDSSDPNTGGGLYIKYRGNIGIGTSSPDTRLHIKNCVNGSTNNFLLTLQNTCTVADARAGIAFLDNDNTAGSGGISGASIQVANNGIDGTGHLLFSSLLNGGVTERVRITSAGNFGIGTSSPCAKLSVKCSTGSIKVDLLSLTTTDGAGSQPTIRFDTIEANCNVLGRISVCDIAPYAGAMIFETSGCKGAGSATTTEVMRLVGTTGNIGMGIASPSYRLHVNGTFYAAGSSVDYKEGISQYNTDSCMFMCLKPVTYQYKDEYTHLGKELKSETQIGLIAEDVAEVYPELAILVNEEDEKVVRNVDYEKLSIILLSELQKLRAEVDELKSK